MENRVKELLLNVAHELDAIGEVVDTAAQAYTAHALRLNVLAVKLRAAVAVEAKPATGD